MVKLRAEDIRLSIKQMIDNDNMDPLQAGAM
jgi:hypothetical protein